MVQHLNFKAVIVLSRDRSKTRKSRFFRRKSDLCTTRLELVHLLMTYKSSRGKWVQFECEVFEGRVGKDSTTSMWFRILQIQSLKKDILYRQIITPSWSIVSRNYTALLIWSPLMIEISLSGRPNVVTRRNIETSESWEKRKRKAWSEFAGVGVWMMKALVLNKPININI